MSYDDPEAWKLVHDLTEAFQYYLIRATVNLAKEKGACEYSNRTKYGNGILPIDTYKSDVDELVIPNELHYDWENLRAMSFNTVYGTQHCPHKCLRRAVPLCQTQQMELNHLERYLSVKKVKKGTLKQIVPQYTTLKNNYTLLWDMESNNGYINIVAVMQKFFDQAISGNWSYNPQQL